MVSASVAGCPCEHRVGRVIGQINGFTCLSQLSNKKWSFDPQQYPFPLSELLRLYPQRQGWLLEYLPQALKCFAMAGSRAGCFWTPKKWWRTEQWHTCLPLLLDLRHILSFLKDLPCAPCVPHQVVIILEAEQPNTWLLPRFSLGLHTWKVCI